MEQTSSEVEKLIEDVIEKYSQYVNPTLANLMRFAGFGDAECSAQGVYVTDYSGNRYIDCLGGYGVFSLGHRHPIVVNAVKEQLERMPLSSKIFFSKPLADLSELLAEITPGRLKYSFICNSGTEAIEGAIKAARIYTKRAGLVSTVGGFHGKTLGALSVTGREVYRAPFEPLLPECTQVPFGDLNAAAKAINENTAAFIVEPIQGEGGIRIPPNEYLPGIRKLCSETGALLIVDEVQTGLGRTGKMFAVEHWGVEPDIITVAKALGGGVMPVGAFVATPEIWEALFAENPLMHTSTFGGNPLACVAAIAAIEVTKNEDLPARADVCGGHFLRGLREVQTKYPKFVVDVRGKGLMIGVEFAHEDIGELVIGGLVRRGVIAAYTLNNPKVIRFEPPLIITEDEIDKVVKALDEAIAETIEALAGII